jgi:SDR family mycofactocin-dependent oxidoreductase
MGKLEGKVAFITGAARGQGRSHAVRLAQEGAHIIGVDLCGPIDTVPYPLGTAEDLAETVQQVEHLDRRMVGLKADVRDRAGLRAAFDEGVSALGRCDIVLANAGILTSSVGETDDEAAWKNTIDIALTGVWNTIKVCSPTLIEQGDGGSIVLTGSTSSFVALSDGSGGNDAYIAAKHAVLGLMRCYANLLAPHSIRVNTVIPTGVNTPMIMNEHFGQWVENHADLVAPMKNLLPVEVVEPVDVSNAVLYLVSDDGRYVTGSTMTVDAGFLARP